MNNDTKLAIAVGMMASAIIITFILANMTYWINHNGKIVALIENGVSPIEAQCALQDDYGKNPTCLVLAARK